MRANQHMVVRWLVLLPHSMKVLGHQLAGVVCVVLVFSPCACMGSLQALWLPPTFMDVRLIGVIELAVGMSAA